MTHVKLKKEKFDLLHNKRISLPGYTTDSHYVHEVVIPKSGHVSVVLKSIGTGNPTPDQKRDEGLYQLPRKAIKDFLEDKIEEPFHLKWRGGIKVFRSAKDEEKAEKPKSEIQQAPEEQGYVINISGPELEKFDHLIRKWACSPSEAFVRSVRIAANHPKEIE